MGRSKIPENQMIGKVTELSALKKTTRIKKTLHQLLKNREGMKNWQREKMEFLSMCKN